MKSFKSFLNEQTIKQEVVLEEDLQWLDEQYLVESAASNRKGVMHELLVGKHLRGGHMEHHDGKTGESPKKMHDRLKKEMTPEEYKYANKRAKHAAEHIRNHIESHGHSVEDVHWTSKPGDLHKSTGIHASQKQDASDIVVHAKDKNGRRVHHGVSLKVTDTNSKHIGVSNPGNGAMYGAHHIVDAHRASLEKQHPALKKSNADKRKAYVKSLHPDEQEKIKEQHTAALRKVADHVHDHLENAGTHAIAEHIRTHVLQSHKTPMQEKGHHHWRVTTHNNSATAQRKGADEHGHHIVNPHAHYEHMLNDHENLTMHKQGTTIVFKHKGKKIATHQMKFNSQSDTHSSLKGNGSPNV